jgi:GNAT superfamily N-acetyltransferase
MSATATQAANVTLRSPEPADVDALAQICFDAFASIDDQHRFPRDFPVLEAAQGIMGVWIPHPQIWGVLAEIDGRPVGSNFLDERDPVPGVGPVSVTPDLHESGIGRRMMEAVNERGEGAQSIRLVQTSYNLRSLSLYASVGYDVVEPLMIVSGKPRSAPVDGVEVRPLEERDLEECEALCKKVHGFTRTGALRDALHGPFEPFVAVRGGKVTAYATTLAFWPLAYGVAASDEDMHALLCGAAPQIEEPLTFIVPTRWELFRWCRAEGIRFVKPLNLMVRGEYSDPTSAWFPSVLY